MGPRQKNEQPETPKPRSLGLKEGLAEMYQEVLLCDTSLIVDGQTFPCHRQDIGHGEYGRCVGTILAQVASKERNTCVSFNLREPPSDIPTTSRALLAAISPYFREMFTSTLPNAGEILLTNVTPSAFRSILKYIYTEEITLTPEQAPGIFAGASQLQIVPLRDISCRFLIANLSMQNCFAMHALARAQKNRPLLRATVKLLTANFEKVCEEQAFLQLDVCTVLTLIASNDLAVASELKIYRAVRRWVSFHPSKRNPHLGTLMCYVRLPLFTPKEQVELQRDLEKWGDLQLKWKQMDSQERLCKAGRLRQGMCKPHILCVDTLMGDYQEIESGNAYMGCYEPRTEKWEKLPGLHSLTHVCCAASDSKIYVSGGACKSSYSSALYEFDSFRCQWVELPSMATPRCAHGFLFYNQSLYAVGGWYKFQSFLSTAERFDVEEGRWSQMAQLPFALSHPASCVFRKKLYFLGGATGIERNWVFHQGFLVYGTGDNVWTQVPLSTAFLGAGAIAVDNGIYIIGGFSEKKPRDSSEGPVVPENRHTSHKCFFINETGKVNYNTGIPKLPHGIANAGVVCCNSRIYVLGGEDLTQHFKTIYHWEPGERRWHRSATNIPIRREGLSRFGCAIWMRPKPDIHQLFQKPSRVPVAAALCK